MQVEIDVLGMELKRQRPQPLERRGPVLGGSSSPLRIRAE
jgi:hypothetical protein